MYEFHGWIKLAESTSEIDEGSLESKCKKLRDVLSKIEWSSGRAELLLLNGLYTLVLNAIPNRRRGESRELNELILLVLEEFKGAYGIIYEYDEQSEVAAGQGVFSVRVVKRGQCESQLDPFLSPVVPVVEDP